MNCDAMMVQIVSYRAPESGWPSSDSSWQCHYILGTIVNVVLSFERTAM